MATWCEELTHLKISWCWERLRAAGKVDYRVWNGWMASPTQWTWVWVNSRSWQWTGRPGVLQSMGSQRVGHDWVTELTGLLAFSMIQQMLAIWSLVPLPFPKPAEHKSYLFEYRIRFSHLQKSKSMFSYTTTFIYGVRTKMQKNGTWLKCVLKEKIFLKKRSTFNTFYKKRYFTNQKRPYIFSIFFFPWKGPRLLIT